MKKLIALVVIALFASVSLKADPPKKVNLKFKDGTLNIEVVHPVKDAAKHYIDQLVVNVDGKEVKVLKIDKQTSKENESIDVKIPEIKKGSVVKVTARCSVFGKKSGKLKVSR